MTNMVYSRSSGQEKLPPDPERTARIEREKEQTRQREERQKRHSEKSRVQRKH